MAGRQHLKAGLEARPSYKRPTPPPDSGWFERQSGAITKAAEALRAALSAADEREAKLAADLAKREERALEPYGPSAGPRVDEEKKAIRRALRREFLSERTEALAEAQSAAADAARELVELAGAADAVRGHHLDPYAYLRRSRRLGPDETLDEVAAAEYRAATSASLRRASEPELRGLAQQAIDDANEILAHCVANELSRRDQAPGAFTKAFPMPDREARAAEVASAVRSAGEALAEWSTWARRGAAASGVATLGDAMRTADRPGHVAEEFGAVVDRLAGLRPDQLRAEPSDDEPVDDAPTDEPTGEARLASALTAPAPAAEAEGESS